jgi:pSer/pThr/pTyr-binding forkhead associated (FHA) protein
MNNIWTIVISAATGGIFTLITGYITTAIAAKKESKKWESETAIKFIDYSLSNPELARKVARQFSIAVIVHLDEDGTTNRKYFLPAFCRFSIGRLGDHDICINDSYLSRDHGLFYYRKGRIIYKDTSPTNRSTVNGKEILKKRRLRNNDILVLGHSKFKFEEL